MSDDTSRHDTDSRDADRLAAELAALRSSVEATVDVDAALQALHRDVGHRGARSGDRRSARARWLAVAASIAVLGGGLAVWRLRDDGVTVSADRVPDVSHVADPLEAFCAEQPRFVYLVPGATPEQERAVGAALEDIEGVGRIVHLDRDATYEEFQRLFADQPEFVESVRPEELPVSYRVWFEPGAAEAVDELDSMEAVLRVERGEQYLCDESGRFTSVGFRIVIDGEPVPAREIAGALANVVTAGSEDRVEQFERMAAAQVVSNRLLTEHGRRHGAPVSEADITAAILEADSLVDSLVPGVPIDPEVAVDDPDVRARVGEGLARSRGLAQLLDGRTFADPAAVDDIRVWFVEQLGVHGVEASTPSGAMSPVELMELAFDWPAG